MRKPFGPLALFAVLSALLPVGSYAQTASALAEDAADLVNAGKYKAAVTKFKKALRHDPNNASLHLSLGLTYQSLSRFTEAIRSIRNAVELSPKSPKAYYSLALLYEAVALQAEDSGTPRSLQRKHLRLAKKAWDKVILHEKEPKKLEIARKHREDIVDQLTEP